MMKRIGIVLLCLVATTVFAGVKTEVDWAVNDREALTIWRPIDGEFVDRCLKGGLEVEYRFLMQACRKRSSWFDTCSRTRKQIHHLRYDPIRRAYLVVTDRLGDEVNPVSTQFPSLREALDQLDRIPSLPLEFLDESAARRFREGSGYFAMRVLSSCKGEYSKTFSQLSYLFTLGLVDLGEEDSGWVDYDLAISSQGLLGSG